MSAEAAMPFATVPVRPEAAAAYPGVMVLTMAATVADGEATDRAVDEHWVQLYDRWHGADEAELLDHPNVRAYRGLSVALGLDPVRYPPSVVALINRGLRGWPPGSWPRINPVVDAVNVVAIRTLTSLGAFDAERLGGEVCLALTGGGEPFLALGANKGTALAANQLVLRDDSRVLSLFSRRDGVHQSVRADTTKILLLGCVVPGVDPAEVVDALDQAHRLLAVAGRESGG